VVTMISVDLKEPLLCKEFTDVSTDDSISEGCRTLMIEDDTEPSRISELLRDECIIESSQKVPCLTLTEVLMESRQVSKELSLPGEYEQPRAWHQHCGSQDPTMHPRTLDTKCVATAIPDPELGGAPHTLSTNPPLPLETQKTLPKHASTGTSPTQGQLTTLEATFTILSWIMNSALFSLPLVFSRSGLVSGLLVMGVACLLVYTASLLGEVLAHLGRSGIPQPTYKEAAVIGFGNVFAICVSVICHMEIAAYAVMSQIMLGFTINDLVPELSFEQIIGISSVLTVCLSVIPERKYAYLSLLSAVALGVACSTVLASGWALPEWACGTRRIGEMKQFPSSLSMILFGAAPHPLLPCLYSSIKSKKSFQHAIVSAWSIWTVCACIFGAGAYYMFGDSVNVVATRNIGRDLTMKPLPTLNGLATFSAWWVFLRNQLAVVAFLRPFSSILANMLSLKPHGATGAVVSFWLSVPAAIATISLASMLKDKMEWMEYISGSVLMNLNAIIFPCLLYLSVCKPEQTSRWLPAVAIGMFGALLQVFTCGLSSL